MQVKGNLWSVGEMTCRFRVLSPPAARCVKHRAGVVGASSWQAAFSQVKTRRSPLGSTGGCFTAIRPTSPGAAGSVGHSCRIKGAPQQARVLAALRAAPACRGRFAPLTRHPLAGSVPPLFRVLSPLRGPRLAPSIIAPGHSSLGPRFTSLSGHRPAMFCGPCVGPSFLACVKHRVGQAIRQASKTPLEAFSRPCRPSGVSEPQKTRCRPAMAVCLRLLEWKGCQGLHRKPHAERSP